MSTTEKKPKAKRPSKVTPDVKDRIDREVALGKSLRSVCKQKDMPSISRVMAVLQEDEAWQERYARARRRGIESHIDGLVDLADEATEDNAHAVRLRVDTRKWIASKLLPKIYGDKLEIEADVRDTREPVDRDSAVLEAGRRIAFMLYQAGELQRDRATQALLPAPAAEHPSAEPKGVAQGADQPTHSPTHDAEQQAADDEQRAERQFQAEIAADVRQKAAAVPQRHAAPRFRRRWDR